MRRSREATLPGDFFKKNHAAGFLHNCARRLSAFHRVNVKERRKTHLHKIRLVEGGWSEVKRLVCGAWIHVRPVLPRFRAERNAGPSGVNLRVDEENGTEEVESEVNDDVARACSSLRPLPIDQEETTYVSKHYY